MAGVLGGARAQLEVGIRSGLGRETGRGHPPPPATHPLGSKAAVEQAETTIESQTVESQTKVEPRSIFTCPRCNNEATERFWGPCGSCREQLVASVRGEAQAVEMARFEPAMNVTPNFVATKD